MLDGVNSVNSKPISGPSPFASPSQPATDRVFLSLETVTSRLPLQIKRPPIGKWLFWSLAFLMTTTVSATLGGTIALLAPLSQQTSSQQSWSLNDLWRNALFYKLSRPVNILVMGIDRVPDVPVDSPASMDGRSDTMLLLRIDPQENSVKLLSIPRDTRVESSELSIKKINQANADGGPKLAAKIVSSTFNDVPIDRYVRVTTDAFRELVDLVGGVEVFVPEKMQYTDETQHLNISLNPGWQFLNGTQAEHFARFRHDRNGDIGRVQRQQTLIKALRERITSPSILPRLPELMRMMQRYVDTNISLEELMALANFALKLDKTDVKMVMLPGRFSQPNEYAASYWIMDEAGRDRILQDYFGIDAKDRAKNRKSARNSIRIAIQNASGQPNMSRRAAEYLKSQGFNNIYLVKDWPDRAHKTQIIVQQGDLSAAEKLQNTLGLGNIEATSTGDIESDLTLRLGEDWAESLVKF